MNRFCRTITADASTGAPVKLSEVCKKHYTNSKSMSSNSSMIFTAIAVKNIKAIAVKNIEAISVKNIKAILAVKNIEAIAVKNIKAIAVKTKIWTRMKNILQIRYQKLQFQCNPSVNTLKVPLSS